MYTGGKGEHWWLKHRDSGKSSGLWRHFAHLCYLAISQGYVLMSYCSTAIPLWLYRYQRTKRRVCPLILENSFQGKKSSLSSGLSSLISLMFHVSSLVSSLLSLISRLLSLTSCLSSLISCLSSLISCLFISHLLSLVGLVSPLLSPVSRLPSPVSPHPLLYPLPTSYHLTTSSSPWKTISG